MAVCFMGSVVKGTPIGRSLEGPDERMQTSFHAPICGHGQRQLSWKEPHGFANVLG